MKRITLYQRLKPEVKDQLQEYYEEYRHSIEDIFKSLHKEEDYNSLTISEVNNLILFSSIRPQDIYDFANGDFAFEEK
jgi:hypothetical protein